MFSRIFLTGLAALVHVGLASADDHVTCQWVPEGSVCIVSVDSPDGDRYTAFQLQLAICAQNIGANGCAEELPELCKSVPITGVGQSACLPVLAPDAISVQDAIKLPEIENCVGDLSPQCNDVRTGFYEVLNCPECAGPANEAAGFEEACIAAKTQPACNAAAAEAADKPAAVPATVPAEAPVANATMPAAVPAEAPVANATMPAGVAMPVEAPAEGTTGETGGADEGAAAEEGAEGGATAVETEETSRAAPAATSAAAAGLALLAAAAAALL